LGITVAVVGAAATAIEMLVILPAVNASGGYDYWSKMSHHPVLEVLGSSAGEKLTTLALTLAVSGLVGLRSPMALIALPTLAWRFASDDANYWGTVYHYSAVLMPIMVAAMIDGLIRIRKRNRPSSRWIVPASLGTALLVAAALVPSHSFAQFATARFWQPNPQTAAITNALAKIPDGATVSASDNLIPQLTSRDSVTLFGLRPLASVRPQWIVVDPESTRHFVVTRAAERRDLLSAEANGYRVAFSQNDITLLARRLPPARGSAISGFLWIRLETTTHARSVHDISKKKRSTGILVPMARFRLTAAVSLVVVAAVIGLGVVIGRSNAISRFELPIDQAISRNHVGIFDGVALTIEWLFSPLQAFVVILLVSAAVFIVKRSWTVTITFALAVLGGWLSSEALKLIAHRARPDYHLLAHPLVREVNFASFPSGHTCAATALGVGLIFLFRGTRTRRWLVPLVVLVLLGVAFSRLYVGAHYPTDVIAALVYTTAAIVAFLALWNRWVSPLLLRRLG
jgi:membrane-associated phospholipid phosphatase